MTGVTVHIPVEVLARLGGDEFSWQVPALREELVTALIKSLPKDLRRNFVPAPDTARIVLASITPGSEPLPQRVAAGTAPPHRCAGADRCVRPRQATRASARQLRHRVRRWETSWDGEGPVGSAGEACGIHRPGGGGGGGRGPRADSAAPLAGRPAGIAARGRAPGVELCWRPYRPRIPGIRGYRFGSGHSVFAAESEQAAATGARVVGACCGYRFPSPVRAIEKALDPRTRLLLGANPMGH